MNYKDTRFLDLAEQTKRMTVSEALLHSIQKWTKMTTVENFDQVRIGALDCALCHKFVLSVADKCVGCPVARYTKASGCTKTPYAEAETAKNGWRLALKTNEAAEIDAARHRFHLAAIRMKNLLETIQTKGKKR